jgi:ATP-binding cassette subfamily B protein/subfamily B ATP-binding cassette protein MsbA
MIKNRGKKRFNRIVFDHLRGEFGHLLFAAFCTLGLVAAHLAWPWPIKIVIDHILLERPLPASLAFLGGLPQADKVLAVTIVSSSIIVFALLRGFCSYAQIYITARIGYQLTYRLRRELFTHLQRLSLSFHHQARTGELLTKITGDTAILKDVFTESALTFATQIITLIGMLIVMFLLSRQLGLIVFSTLPVLMVALFYLQRKVRKSVKRQRRREGQISSRLNEVLSAVSMVQAFGQSEYEVRRFETENAGTLEDSIRTARMEAAATRFVEIISAFGTSGVVLFGALQVIDGVLTPGDLLVFTGYLNSMYRPIRNIAKLSTRFSKAAVGAERIAEILDVEPEILNNPNAIQAEGLQGDILFDSVSFSYGAGASVLKGITCHLKAGRKTALVGGSGAGKSTFVSLILRLYDPQSGVIAIDGIDIKHYQVESLRREIAIVQQDSLLLGASIRENIAYGKLDATMDEIVTAAKLAMAHDFIEELDDGYETVIGERGDTLSGGQRKRIAIARAIIRNASILILDEPMAGLDVESEAKVLEAMDHLMAGKTCLLITHDLQAAHKADHILVLDHGQIVEQGHPLELLARGLKYSQLHEIQSGHRNLQESSI